MVKLEKNLPLHTVTSYAMHIYKKLNDKFKCWFLQCGFSQHPARFHKYMPGYLVFQSMRR